jgi:polyhydroxyalkanoate synthesis regulator phasin
MNDFVRDRATGALIFRNPEKEREIMHQRSMKEEIKTLREEINTLKRQVQELLAARN